MINKHRCGSCRYFQDAGLAGSGWCHHPHRKTTSDLLIMVRRNELACRDEWSHSLWEPGAFEQTNGPHLLPAPNQPVTPATEVEIAALLNAQSVVHEPEDMVLNEARIVSNHPSFLERRPSPAQLSVGEPRQSMHDLDTKTAIKRARETYRERNRAHSRTELEEMSSDRWETGPPGTPQLLDLPDPGERVAAYHLNPKAAPEPSDEQVLNRLPGASDEEPSTGIVRPRFPFGRQADEPESLLVTVNPDTDHAESRLDREEAVVEFDAPVHSTRNEPGAGGTGDPVNEPEAKDWDLGWHDPLPFHDRSSVGYASEWNDSTVWEEVPTDDGVSRRQEDSNWTEPLTYSPPLRPIETPWSVATGKRSSDPRDNGDACDEGKQLPSDPSNGPIDSSGDDDAPAIRPSVNGPHPLRPAGQRVKAQSPLESAWSTVELLPTLEHDRLAENGGAADDGEPRPAFQPPAASPSVATTRSSLVVEVGVPAVCRTCRSYRPGEGGERGWCANRWAFTHRQLVDPDDAEPCESSIGSWWLPADDVYLAAADVSMHGQPTPHLDRWLPHHHEHPAERKRS